MSSDSDWEELFQILTACTTVTKDNVLEFSQGLEKKYANEKQFFRTLLLRGHVGLPTDKMAMSLVPEDLPLEPEIAATRTSPDGNCLFNAVSLALVGDETQMSLLRLLVAVELLLNCEFYIQHPRFTSFSSADHQEDKLFSLCLTRESDKVYVDTNKSKEDAIWSEALIATKSKEWSGFFHIAALSTVIARPIFSAYPNCQTWIRDFLHSEICPREIQNIVPLEPLFVLWTRDGNLDNRRGAWYSPNHFVPLYSTGKGSISGSKEKEIQPKKHNQETVPVKSANQRKRPLTLDGYFGSQSSKRKKEKELNFASGADEERKPLKNNEPPTTSSNQPQRQQTKLQSKQEPTKSCERPDERKQAKDEQKRRFIPQWRDEFPWLNFNGDKNVMTCDICCKHPSVAGKTDFLKGCTNFKKETIKKYATSNGHIRAWEKSFAEEKTIEESQIFQTFSKINKDMQAQDQKEMEIKPNTAYFVAKEELPFSKSEGLLSLQRKNGVSINVTYANEKSCAGFVSFLLACLKDLIQELNSKNFFSIMADGSAR